jgi:hypothetical protein
LIVKLRSERLKIQREMKEVKQSWSLRLFFQDIWTKLRWAYKCFKGTQMKIGLT